MEQSALIKIIIGLSSALLISLYFTIDAKNESNYKTEIVTLKNKVQSIELEKTQLRQERDHAVEMATNYQDQLREGMAISESLGNQLNEILTAPREDVSVGGLSHEDKMDLIRNSLFDLDSVFTKHERPRSTSGQSDKPGEGSQAPR